MNEEPIVEVMSLEPLGYDAGSQAYICSNPPLRVTLKLCYLIEQDRTDMVYRYIPELLYGIVCVVGEHRIAGTVKDEADVRAIDRYDGRILPAVINEIYSRQARLNQQLALAQMAGVEARAA